MKILIVDDSKTVRLITDKMLRDMGYANIITAEDYENAVAILQKDAPDLIISDMNMPEHNGIDLLTYIHSIPGLAKIPFILMTTFEDQKTIKRAHETGIKEIMSKPLEKNDLYNKMVSLSKLYGFSPPKS